MPYIRAALLAWQLRKPLVIGCLALILLPLLLFATLVAALYAVPLASDDHVRMYTKAASELNDTTGLALDYRMPMAIDAVRLNQDFSGVTLDRARQTVRLFLDKQTKSLRTLGQVMDALGFTHEQQETALALTLVDFSSTFCFSFVATERAFVWPVNGEITSCFGQRTDPFHGGYAMHWGIDVAAPEGTPVRAAHAGKVTTASYSGDYGNLVVLVDEGDDLHSWYGHLQSFAVAFGERVERGQVIGYVGSTGRSTGDHLHFELRREAGTQPVDPTTLY